MWVAKAFREEHRAALDWLNARTDPDTRFFGVDVSAVRIGDSLPAPLFHVAAQPNDWGKSVRTRTQSHDGSATERNLLYAEFWDRFLDALRNAGLAWTRARKGPQQNWLPTPSGVSYVDFTVSFGKQGLLSEIFFGHPDPEVNTARFETFLQARETLEATYGGALSFEPLDARKGCRIGDRRPGAITEQQDWPSYIEWFVDSQRRLRDAVAAVGGTDRNAGPTANTAASN